MTGAGRFIFLVLLTVAALPGVALGQARGGVTGIGLDGVYRAGNWTPLRVRIDGAPQPGAYQIRVEQRDLDGQRVFYTTDVTLTAGGSQAFEVYFQPDPVVGLPDNPREFVDQFRVTLVDEDDNAVPLNVGQPPTNVERLGGTDRGIRLVPVVSPRRAPDGDYNDPRLRGVVETTLMPTVRPDQLPSSMLGYEAIDAVLWGDYPPDALSTDQRRALGQFVENGGHLVLMQRPAEWQTMLGWGGLLPVNLAAPTREGGGGPLPGWAVEPPAEFDEFNQRLRNPWQGLTGPFVVGSAEPKPGASVQGWWDVEAERSERPYLVRQAVGRGAVTYVGQDLTDPELVRGRNLGWSGVWAEVFGWGDTPEFLPGQSQNQQIRDRGRRIAERWNTNTRRDLGFMVLEQMKLSGRSATLVLVALVFFVAYWLLAGPGLYLWLAAKKRTGASWFLFGAAAVAATLLTLGIVWLALRGDPQAAHSTLVRADATGKGNVTSRLGLYIPSDGNQAIALADADELMPSPISPYVGDPAHTDEANRRVPGEYEIPVPETGTVAVEVPYRSTLKKLEFDWHGDFGDVEDLGGIAGAADLYPPGSQPEGQAARLIDLRGTLVNNTGRDLTRVYLVFGARRFGGWQTYMLYVPQWRDRAILDIAQTTHGNGTEELPAARRFVGNRRPTAFGNERIFGRMNIRAEWPEAIMSRLRGNNLAGSQKFDDVRVAVPVLSLFDLFPPLQNEQGVSGSRAEVLRRDSRDFAVSAAVTAGSLVVVAESADPAPLPGTIEVNGEVPEASGQIIYQFILPIDRSRIRAAEAQAEASGEFWDDQFDEETPAN